MFQLHGRLIRPSTAFSCHLFYMSCKTRKLNSPHRQTVVTENYKQTIQRIWTRVIL